MGLEALVNNFCGGEAGVCMGHPLFNWQVI